MQYGRDLPVEFAAVEPTAQFGEQMSDEAFVGRVGARFLGVEAVVERGARDAGASGDITDADRRVTARGYQFGEGDDQPLPLCLEHLLAAECVRAAGQPLGRGEEDAFGDPRQLLERGRFAHVLGYPRVK